MHMPLLRGRDFTEHDRKESAGVVVIDEALARRFFANSDPIGTHLRVTLGEFTSDRDYEVVGIVPSVKHNTLIEEALPTFYGPMPQIPKPVAGFLANNFSLDRCLARAWTHKQSRNPCAGVRPRSIQTSPFRR